MGYPPKMFTSPNYVDSDTGIETIPLHIPNLDKYCQMCISKKTRCICKPLSTWDADLIDITQPDSTHKNNDGDDRQEHLLPSDWSEQENFWNGKTYDKVRPTSFRQVQLQPPKCDSEESNWNENLYPKNYRAKVQSQVPPTKLPPGWPKGIRNNNNSNDKFAENTSDKMLKSIKPQEEKGHEGIQIVDTVSISKEAFEAVE